MDKNYIINKTQDNEFVLRSALEELLKYWYWFLLSVGLALTLAFIYLLITPPSYKLSGIIMVDNQTKANVPQEASTFTGIGGFSENNDAEKAVYILESKQLMRIVLHELQLNVLYSVQGGFVKEDFYKNSPVSVNFINPVNPVSTFTITQLSQKKYQLSQVTLRGQPSNYVTTGSYGDTIISPMGVMVIHTTAFKNALDKPVIVTNRDMEDIVNYYSKAVVIELADEKAGVIQLSLVDANFKRAEDILNTLIKIYNIYTISQKNESAENTSNFIKGRVKLIATELGELDKEIEEYKKNNNLTDITSEAESYLGSGNEYRSATIEIKTQISLVRHFSAYLNNPQNKNQLLPADIGIDNVGLGNLLMSYNQTLTYRNKLLENSSDKSPTVQNLDKVLSSARTTLIRSLESQDSVLMIKLHNATAQEKVMAGHIGKIPTEQKEVQSISRVQTIKEGLYLYLLQKREENELNLAITQPNAHVIDYADGSIEPVKPNKIAVISIAFFIGLAIPSGLIYLRQLIDTKVRYKSDIDIKISVPVLGDLPIGDKSLNKPFVVTKSGGNGVAEALRIIRTNLKFVLPHTDEGKVIMVTSTYQGEGKTFMSVNLAMSIALTQKKVVLINTDIRKKRGVAEPFDTASQGLTNFLIDEQTDVKTIIKKSDVNQFLDIISSGPFPPNPAELLLNERLDKLINHLKGQYDYIILDNVPIGQVADPLIINRVSDLTIYVIRAGVLDRRVLPDIENLYNNKLKNMTIVINGSKKKHGYGYGYG